MEGAGLGKGGRGVLTPSVPQTRPPHNSRVSQEYCISHKWVASLEGGGKIMRWTPQPKNSLTALARALWGSIGEGLANLRKVASSSNNVRHRGRGLSRYLSDCCQL